MEETLISDPQYTSVHFDKPHIPDNVLLPLKICSIICVLLLIFIQADTCKYRSGENKMKREYV
jgi:hypothetical protein